MLVIEFSLLVMYVGIDGMEKEEEETPVDVQLELKLQY